MGRLTQSNPSIQTTASLGEGQFPTRASHDQFDPTIVGSKWLCSTEDSHDHMDPTIVGSNWLSRPEAATTTGLK